MDEKKIEDAVEATMEVAYEKMAVGVMTLQEAREYLVQLILNAENTMEGIIADIGRGE